MAQALNDNGSLVTFNIKIGGSAITENWAVLSLEVYKKLNAISSASFVILDGQPDTGKFEGSSSALFLPGKEVVIEAGYDSKNEVVFKGIIIRQSIKIDDVMGSSLEIECRDIAIKMTVGRKSLTFSKQADSAIITSVIGTYSGLSSTVKATTTVWPQQVQHHVTDWDYILSRAEINGLVISTINGKISVFDPTAATSPTMTVGYGNGLIAFNGDLNAVYQYGNVSASTWDFKTQTVVSSASSNNLAGPGNLASKKLAEVVGLEKYLLQTTAPFEKDDLENWSKAQLLKSELSKIQGQAKFQGTNQLELGNYITLSGLGDRFNGDHLVSAIKHEINDGDWITEVGIGLSDTWFIEQPDVVAPTASGLLPGARGLFNATVKKMYEDPDSQFRILIDIPLFDNKGEGIWARLSNFYATSTAGAFFLPEVGDEVVVGFLNEDPRYPVILGSLYSNSKIKPFTGLEPNQKNSIKAIVSKSGIVIEFNDEDIVLTVKTPDKNTITLDDKNKKITLADDNGNTITMSDSGIMVKSPKNISFEADQKVSIKGTTGINIESGSGDVEVKGLNIKETAQMQYSSEGGQISKISSGMQMTIKSAMININ
jgi:Rhs element Vgr protein